MVAANKTTPARFTAALIAELEARLQSGDLRGHTAEQLERAIERYRNNEAVCRGGR